MNPVDAVFQDLGTINPDPYPWMLEKKFTLIKDPKSLREAIDRAIKAGRCALDLETTGLDNRIDEVGRTYDQIVGYCFSFDGEEGFYVPVRHMVKNPVSGMKTPHPDNVPPLVAAEEFKRLVENCVTIYHNAIFDLEFLYGSSAHVEDLSPSQFEDTIILDYLKDSTSKRHGLKHLSKEYLGMEMLDLKQLFPRKEKDLDFSTLDPNLDSTLYYAGADGICTYLLWQHLKGYAKEQPAVYGVEKALVPALRWTERNRMKVDLFYANNLHEEVTALIEDLQNEIYAELAAALGRPEDQVRGAYDINSPQQLGKAFTDLQKVNRHFSRLEFEVTEKSGQIKTDKATMESMAKDYGDRFPFLDKIQQMRGLQKIEGTYLKPIIANTDKRDSTIRFSFKPHRVDTGRFAASKGKPGHGYSGINVQSVPATYNYGKFKLRRIIKRPNGVGDLSAGLEENLERKLKSGFHKRVYDGHFIRDNKTGDEYCARKTCEGCPFEDRCEHDEVKKKLFYSLESAVRPALVAREGYVLVACDYSGLELRAVASICEEPRWIKEFYRCGTCGHEYQPPKKLPNGKWEIVERPPNLCTQCGSDKIGDLHTLTAQLIYGDDVVKLPPSEFKERRQTAKAVNFAIVYGGGGGAIARATGVDSKEGWNIRNRILKGLPVFGKWMERVIHNAHQNLEVETAIGRKIRLWEINSEEGWIRAKQERNAVNSIVQGTATGDLIKYAMASVYKEVKKRDWLDICRMVLTIHDELVFEIAQDHLDEVIPVINKAMSEFADRIKWPIPLITDIEYSKDWTPAYNWTLQHALNPETKLAEEGVPEFLLDKISFKLGMWYEDSDSGDVMVFDGDRFVSKSEYLSNYDGGVNMSTSQPTEESLQKPSKDATAPPVDGVGETLSENFGRKEMPLEVPEPVLPMWEFKSHVNLVGESSMLSYMARLKRVTDACRVMKKAGVTKPTHTLRVLSVQGEDLLPSNKIIEVDPEVFSILAFYEGL